MCPLVVHCWADLQSVHGFRCYNNIVPNVKCQRVLVFTLCLVLCCCRELIDVMMSSDGRKLCFDGQELVQALIMHFDYDEKQGPALLHCGVVQHTGGSRNVVWGHLRAEGTEPRRRKRRE